MRAGSSTSSDSLRRFEVNEIRGHVKDGSVDYWQVSLKIGFTLDDPQPKDA